MKTCPKTRRPCDSPVLCGVYCGLEFVEHDVEQRDEDNTQVKGAEWFRDDEDDLDDD